MEMEEENMLCRPRVTWDKGKEMMMNVSALIGKEKHREETCSIPLNQKFEVSSCLRRITNGSIVGFDVDTSFMVYIVAAKTADSNRGWLCGGSIIHPYLVLTSASCLELGTSTRQMYAITGYKKYVGTEDLEKDVCTRRMKKKIVSYCLHANYAHGEDEYKDTSSERKYRWLKFDIGIARVETLIDFYDHNYLKFCSYLPSTIRTNYNSKYELPGNHGNVYGWGHAVYFRPEGDLNDYNERFLRYASSAIIERDDCQHFFANAYIQKRVARHFICVDGTAGYFNAAGQYLAITPPTLKSCGYRRNKAGNPGINGTLCIEDVSHSNKTNLNNDTVNFAITRRHGICQNDHGSPLVVWIGGHPYVIGVATAFRVNKRMECVGPYMYSSVLCTSKFINCILEQQNTIKTSRRIASNCNDQAKGYTVEEKDIEWSDEDF